MLSTQAPASQTRPVIQRPGLASGNRPTVEILGRHSLRRLVRSPLSRRGLERTVPTALETRSSVVRSARSLLTQQVPTISTYRLHVVCGALAPLLGVQLQIRQRRDRLSACLNRLTVARRLASSGMEAALAQ